MFLRTTSYLCLAVFIYFSPRIDLAVSGYFFDAAAGHFEKGWGHDFIFTYGTWPAWGLGFFCLGFLLFSYYQKHETPWKAPALAFLLTLIVGAGLFTNVILKDQWGRPRPVQTENFCGKYPYRPFYKPYFFRAEGPCRSLPCGHGSVGFVFLSLAFSAKRMRRTSWVAPILVLTGIFSVIICWTRIAQGGHYLTDAVAVGFLMSLTAWGADRLAFEWFPNLRTGSRFLRATAGES